MMLALLILWKARRLIVALSIALALAAIVSDPRSPGRPSIGAAEGVRCHERGGLPDPRCTPGAVRAGVSLARICAYGDSSSIRPPESYTEALKLRQMRAYRLAGSPRDYEEDHLVPLSIGGAPRDPANLWPEPRRGPDSAEQKDELETWAARTACGGRIPLARLQRAMARDWIALYDRTGSERVLHAYPPGG